LTEENIIKGCIRGRSDCQRMLFDRYAGQLMSLCQRYARDYEEAQDFLQLGFIRIFEYLHQYRGEGSLEGWMRRLVARVAIREISKRKWHLDESSIPAAQQPVEDPAVWSKISEEEIHRLICKLPEGYRLVFNLHVIEGYSHEEIGELLSIQPSTSRSQLLKARRLLQSLISNQMNCVKE